SGKDREMKRHARPDIQSCLIVALLMGPTFGLLLTSATQAQTFTTSWDSLSKHEEAPEWFRDAKFGIYFHWGVYCVPAFGSEWYPRNMHLKNQREYKHHLETYGDPTEFGYHDFVPKFKAEFFDADEWADLFAKAGARFAGPVAEHHDGFSMWDSDQTPWNAKDMGPKRDITGELAEAVRKRGMRLVTTFHHARNNLYQIERNGQKQWTGHYDRVKIDFPSLLDDPKQAILYGYMPREDFLKMWKGKLMEVIDKYQPDLMWFDSWLDEIPEQTRMEYLAYYFNKARQWNKDVVVTFKQKDLPQDVGVLDLEKGRMGEMTDFYWLTDDTISLGSWCYTQDLRIKPTKQVLHSLIDIVSKNGVLLLNISPKANGTIPEVQQKVLLEIGQWLAMNGEAIYNTRTWYVFGEGPTNRNLPKGHFGGVADPSGGYQPQDIRFTRSKDAKTIYAIAMGWPGESTELLITSLAKERMQGDMKIQRVSMLGSREAIPFQWRQDGLSVKTPARKGQVNDLAVVFKIETTGSATFLKQEEAIPLTAEQAVLDGDQIHTEERAGRTNIGFWDRPQESVHWLVRVPEAGSYLVRGEFAAGAGATALSLTVDRKTTTFTVDRALGWDSPAFTNIGKITFESSGVHHVILRPADPSQWRAINVWQIQLIPQ
ncbi:MAG: alpha-L-fucosidase, partial [Sedimentisphaerales bacterium]|nr:alpha-L-fucosidase [Sedimentisphaerales bacterium]